VRASRPAPALTVLPGLVTADEHGGLRREARSRRASATRNERPRPTLTPEGRALCAVRNWYADGGDVAQAVHRDGLGPRLHQAFGELVDPSHSSYLYYGQDDFLGVHRDHPTCELTVLMWLWGPAGSVRFHPNLADVSEEEILILAERYNGHPDGGIDIDLTKGAVVVRGSEVPHHRPPHPHNEELTLATFCFASALNAPPERED
jgi:hypothetical protein